MAIWQAYGSSAATQVPPIRRNTLAAESISFRQSRYADESEGGNPSFHRRQIALYV
jgi:hypothetical protein